MRPSRRPLIIATRRSSLAQAQARAVAAALCRLHPAAKVDLLPLESEGDRAASLTSDRAPAGGKGLFTGAIERAVLDGRADLAVHSLKDLPVADTPGLILAAFPKRGDVRDCLVSRADYDLPNLPEGAVVGTGSLRRAAELRRNRPDLRIEPIRGNVETRLAKVLGSEAGGAMFDATLLAMAGLQRNGLAEHATRPLEPGVMLPAAGQAALALQCRADDHVTLRRLMPLNDAGTALCVACERQVVAGLEADCRSPLGVLAVRDDQKRLHLRVRVLSADGTACLEADERMSTRDARRLVDRVVDQLRADGAADLLHAPAPA